MTYEGELGVVRALICEDEPLGRRAMQEYLRDVDWITVEGTAADGKEALRMIHKLEPDLVFLDVRMPGLTGLEVLEALEHRPAVVFTTAFDEYAIAAFEHGAVDYLVKPFGRERLIRTLDRVRVRLTGESRAGRDGAAHTGAHFADRIFARHRGAAIPVHVGDVLRMEAVDGGVALHLGGDRRAELDATLGEVEARLNPRDFVRVHRSHVVNLNHVTSIRRYDERRFVVKVADGSSIVASRSGSRALKSLME